MSDKEFKEFKEFNEGDVILCTNAVLSLVPLKQYTVKKCAWPGFVELEHVPGRWSVDRFRLVAEMPKFKANDLIIRTKVTASNFGILIGKVYKIESFMANGDLVVSSDGVTLKDSLCPDLFDLLTNVIKDKPYKSWSPELKLEVIRLRLQGNAFESSKDCGKTWAKCATLTDQDGIHMYRDRHYRAFVDNSETLKSISEVEEKMKGLQKQLNKLKKNLQ